MNERDRQPLTAADLPKMTTHEFAVCSEYARARMAHWHVPTDDPNVCDAFLEAERVFAALLVRVVAAERERDDALTLATGRLGEYQAAEQRAVTAEAALADTQRGLEAIAEAPYGTFANKADYAALVRDLARNSLAQATRRALAGSSPSAEAETPSCSVPPEGTWQTRAEAAAQRSGVRPAPVIDFEHDPDVLMCDGCGATEHETNATGWYRGSPHPSDGISDVLCPECFAKVPDPWAGGVSDSSAASGVSDTREAAFVKQTWEAVLWGDEQVEAGALTVLEQSRRIRAALGDALAWIERAASPVPAVADDPEAKRCSCLHGQDPKCSVHGGPGSRGTKETGT